MPEIPHKIRNEMHFTYVRSMDEVVREALLPPLDGDDGLMQDEAESQEPAVARSRSDRAVPRPQPLEEPAHSPDLVEIEPETELPLPDNIGMLPEESSLKLRESEPPGFSTRQS